MIRYREKRMHHGQLDATDVLRSVGGTAGSRLHSPEGISDFTGSLMTIGTLENGSRRDNNLDQPVSELFKVECEIHRIVAANAPEGDNRLRRTGRAYREREFFAVR